jgi:hypothetical protein
MFKMKQIVLPVSAGEGRGGTVARAGAQTNVDIRDAEQIISSVDKSTPLENLTTSL